MGEPESREDENLRLSLALLEDKEEALGEILRLYGPDVEKLLTDRYVHRKKLLKVEDMEDVMAIAIAKVWDGRKTYDDQKQTLRAWFYCIAEHAALDVMKHGWYQARALEEYPGPEWFCDEKNPNACEPPPVNKQERQKAEQRLRDLREVVNKLPEKQRRIVLADAACRERVASSEYLAADLDMPRAHVKVYRDRAMKTIRSEMRKRGYDIPSGGTSS
jgi:RNA polymerase sigma factor (sigma-70 family)